MADGVPQITSFPLVYTLRHMPARRKQAETSSVLETQVLRLPSWSGQQAPVVGTLRRPGKTRIQYRAARGADGVVRLVAPVDSQAFGRLTVMGHQQAPADSNNIHLFRYSMVGREALRNMHEEPLPSSSPAIGAHLSSDRASALRYTAGLASSMVLVDARLHAPCGEPAWMLNFCGDAHHADQIFLCHKHAIPWADWAQGTNWAQVRMSSYMPFCPDTRGFLERRGVSDQYPTSSNGQIVEDVAGCLSGDAEWTMMLALSREVQANAQKSIESLTQDERRTLWSLDLPKTAYQPPRDADLAAAILKCARVLHAVSASTNSDTLKAVRAAMAGLAENPQPEPLEARLARAGVAIPALPGHGVEFEQQDHPAAPGAR